ncbi:MAG: quinone-interacting membrane-bound oxidoreductase complex subunit QmoC [Desulfobacteraceae bacterium]|nr:quinone-interacting membrane-bound oxidoreductase complex subunit QmoC [Desulfobacteraceae bacterium]
MAEKYLAQPDLNFIKEVRELGGESLNKCFQCATCTIACPISPEDSPFPRKEMIAASWGLKDKLITSGDIWLCHECGDCSDLCPRDAKPGDVLSAIRSVAITEYARPKFLAKAVNNPKALPFLIGIPAIWFAILAIITMTAGDTMTKIFHGVFGDILGGRFHWAHAHEPGVIAHADFFSTWFVDLTFVPTAIFATLVFALGLKDFIRNIHENAMLEGKTNKKKIEIAGFLKALGKVIIPVLKHDKFNECEADKDRSTPHMMVLFSFIGLFIVTSIFFIALYVLNSHAPYSQINPVKWLANISAVALIIGVSLMIRNRLAKKDTQLTFYKDWYILGLIFILAVSGLLAELVRLAGFKTGAYFCYYIHLIAILNLFLFLPFSKMAHFVYRLVSMAYAEYSGRKY